MSRGRVGRRVAFVAGVVSAGWACAARAPVAPSPGGDAGDIVRRHWDQACSVNEREPVFAELAELFDTVGLADELARVELVPRPLAPPWPVVDFITRYAADGRPRRSGLWEPTAPAEVAERVGDMLTRRIRALPGLLEPTGFRTRVVFATRTRVETAAPVLCLPHMIHERGKRATGLPDTVGTWGGRQRVTEGNDSTAVVRIVVDVSGRVTRLDSLQGTVRAMTATREVVAALRFEPALRNGEAVEGEIVQTFRFRRAGSRDAVPRPRERIEGETP